MCHMYICMCISISLSLSLPLSLYVYIYIHEVVRTPRGGSGGLPQTNLTIICVV